MTDLTERLRRSNALICDYVLRGDWLSEDDCAFISEALRDAMARISEARPQDAKPEGKDAP